MGITNEPEKHTVTSKMLDKYNGVITYNNTDRGKDSTVVKGLCLAPSLIDLLSRQ